ncbi:hypothetical protein BM526_20405 (plasmid) [Alteromonas mediterranea]|uniref:hypothetical protein n=1 Tax=Alteromonas mediterranea TaxID=314275 RepID=UPI000903666F|nr:hypothetical protein [Alteromonas mediterranea]APE04336.1 hypothetical protein BM526_20405 [Alteromonas mediterranea]
MMLRLTVLSVILFCIGCTNDAPQSKTEAIIKKRTDIDKDRDAASEKSIRLAKETLLDLKSEYSVVDIELHGVSMTNEFCRHEREILRGKVLSDGKLSLVCLPESYQFAYSRPAKSSHSLSYECEPVFHPGFILVGKINGPDTNSIQYSCISNV